MRQTLDGATLNVKVRRDVKYTRDGSYREVEVVSSRGSNVIFHYTQMHSALTTASVNTFLQPLRQNMTNLRRSSESNEILILLNSGVWDILESGPQQEFAHFEDHERALEMLISGVEKEFPDVTLAWKSLTGMHIHNVDCSQKRFPKREHRVTCLNRVKYMSSSRARYLNELQAQLMLRHPQVRVIQMYDQTYNSAHLSMPKDGRHYLPAARAAMWRLAFDPGAG